MMESVKTFFKDMNELDKHQREFLKKHWKGYTVYYMGTTLAVWAVLIASNPDGREYLVEEIKEKGAKIKNKFDKKEKL